MTGGLWELLGDTWLHRHQQGGQTDSPAPGLRYVLLDNDPVRLVSILRRRGEPWRVACPHANGRTVLSTSVGPGMRKRLGLVATGAPTPGRRPANAMTQHSLLYMALAATTPLIVSIFSINWCASQPRSHPPRQHYDYILCCMPHCRLGQGCSSQLSTRQRAACNKILPVDCFVLPACEFEGTAKVDVHGEFARPRKGRCSSRRICAAILLMTP